MKLNEVVFPVYVVGHVPPIEEDGETYYIAENGEKLYVDSKLVPGESLGLRRSKLLASGKSLYKITKSAYFVQDFIKLSSSKLWFIDYSGKVFTYKKTKRVKAVVDKVRKIIPLSTGGALVEGQTIPGRFKTLYMPSLASKYIVFLKDGLEYIFYGVYEDDPSEIIKRRAI